ncbi:MAG: methionine biosynthesis protein MetW [Verrucomicrobiae bacterium]|nr:methionine biosynthesis protein MetW [Verrucomicrobiae bacterium]
MNPGVYATVERWIPEKSRVLDLGTGDGAFLARLAKTRQVIGEGVEKDPALVTRCVERGLVVHQGDIADGLDQHANGAFDFVLLLGTFQELVQPAEILQEAFRVGRQIILSYSNFAHYWVRLQLLFHGRTPVTRSLPTPWHRTRNLHFLSVADFEVFCGETGIRQTRRAFFNGNQPVQFLPNLRAETALSLLDSARPPAAAPRKSEGGLDPEI